MPEKKIGMDMCSGSILWKMICFVFPLFCTYELQSLFNAADMAIIGKFDTPAALAAIGATMNPITLVQKIFIGLATGANAVIATRCGAKDNLNFHRGVHTSMAIGMYGGLVMMVIALLCAKPILLLMNTPADVLPQACTYIWINFLGIPFLMAFNFGYAILRSVGDTKRPMYYLIAAGFLNVILNLLFVAVFHWSVAGVALATTISNGLAAILVILTLHYTTDSCHLDFKWMKINWKLMREILWIGIPASVNSSFFNVANMFIQAAINGFGALAIAGSAATVTVESFVTISASAFQQAAMTFTAQNFGAKNYTRTARCCAVSLLLASGSGLLLGWGFLLFGRELLSLFTSDPEVICWGMRRMKVMLIFYFLGAIMDIACGCLRGLGHSMIPAIASLLGACIFRIIWVLCAFPCFGTLESLLYCYPISWILVSIFNCTMLYVVLKKLFRRELGQNRLALFP